MHLGRASSQRGHGLEVQTHAGRGCFGQRPFGEQQQRTLARLDKGSRRRLHGVGFVVEAQLFQRPGPTVALIGHQLLQHAQGEARALAVDEFQSPAKARNMGEGTGLGQVVNHLAVGIGTRAGPAEELENQFLAIANRGVALLCGAAAGRQRRAGLAVQGGHQTARHSHERARFETHALAPLDHAEQPLAETVVHRGVEKGALAALDRWPAKNRGTCRACPACDPWSTWTRGTKNDSRSPSA